MDGHNIFSRRFVVRIVMFKRPRIAHFFKKVELFVGKVIARSFLLHLIS